jgi:hypothetical protein
MSFDEYMPGRVVAYAEDVAAAELSLADPLKPKTQYFWSVRLRRGDQVSSWSFGGHKTYLIIAATWSSGRWFGFETP